MSETVETVEQAAPEAPRLSVDAELAKIRSVAADALIGVEENQAAGMIWITVKPQSIVRVLQALRDDRSLEYKMLSDLSCIDRPDLEKRFTVFYNLLSISKNKRIFLRVNVAEGENVPSAAPVYTNADWAEREVYDLFGVVFHGHPDLRRIELPDDWVGHPLRKDYPIVGKKPVLLYNNVKDIL